MADLSLHCSGQAFSSCSEWGLLSSCGVRASHCGGLSCCRAQALEHAGFSSWGVQAELLQGIWDLPRAPGIKPVPPALAIGFLTFDHQASPSPSFLLLLLCDLFSFQCSAPTMLFLLPYANKGPSSQSYGFSSSHGCESWTIKKAECWKIDAFELWCWRRLLRVRWTAMRLNLSILKKSVLNIH